MLHILTPLSTEITGFHIQKDKNVFVIVINGSITYTCTDETIKKLPANLTYNLSELPTNEQIAINKIIEKSEEKLQKEAGLI